MNKQKILNGERIQLRLLTEKNATQKYVNWMNDPEVNQCLESRFCIHTLESIKSFINDMHESPDDYFYGIFLNNEHIGNIKLHINSKHNHGDIGYLIGEKQYWGKGYITEAIQIIAEYGFNELDLNKIYAGVYANNIGSIKALQKSGFVIEGIQERQYLCNGKYVNGILVGKLRK